MSFVIINLVAVGEIHLGLDNLLGFLIGYGIWTYFVTFLWLISHTTCFARSKTALQMYWKKPRSSPQSLGPHLERLR